MINTVMRMLVPVYLFHPVSVFGKGAGCVWERRERIYEEIRGRSKEDPKLNLYDEGLGISSFFNPFAWTRTAFLSSFVMGISAVYSPIAWILHFLAYKRTFTR